MDKKALRAEIRAKKRALTEEQIVRYSEELAQKLFAHPLYQAAKSIYGYMSYNQEVRTMPILRQAQADGKRVAVPKVYGDEMKFLWLNDLNRTVSGAYSIPEPVGDEPEAADETALILMPGLAFDPAGHRCGYGGGFYDNIPRVLPNQVEAHIDFGSWEMPPVFKWLHEVGELSWPEILQIFNGGIGYVLVLPEEQVEETINRIQAFGMSAWSIGTIARRNGDGEQVVVNFDKA